MKLYTEEQVIELCMLFGSYYNYSIKRTKQIIEENQKPIKLPTDEEMDEYVYDNITPPSLDKGDGVEQTYFDTGFYVGFRAFAEWMRDKIQDQAE